MARSHILELCVTIRPALLDASEDITFEYEGEMPPELALDPETRENYPFMRLTEPANVLTTPSGVILRMV